MKKNSIVFLIAIFILGTAFKIADDIITRIGLQRDTAQTFIVNNFIGRFDYGPMRTGVAEDPYKAFQVPYMRSLPSIIAGDKAGAAIEMCEYVKKYVESEEFLIKYKETRDASLPLTDKGMGLRDLKKNKAVCETNIRNYPNDTKYVGEQQKLVDEYQKRIDALLAEAKTPYYGKEEYEKAYPADPSAIIKKRLQEYLQLAATVDFNAKLTEPDKYKKRKFINPEYEKKSLKWKAVYRAGKEVNDAVAAFVKDWLKQGVKIGINPSPVVNPNAAANNTKTATATTATSASTNQPAVSTPTTNGTTTPATDTATAETGAKPEKKKKGLKGLTEKAKRILNR